MFDFMFHGGIHHGIQLGASGFKFAPETISDTHIPFAWFHDP
jgi:hypothetical protein